MEGLTLFVASMTLAVGILTLMAVQDLRAMARRLKVAAALACAAVIAIVLLLILGVVVELNRDAINRFALPGKVYWPLLGGLLAVLLSLWAWEIIRKRRSRHNNLSSESRPQKAEESMTVNVFEKIRDAHSSGEGVTLSHADVELLLETLGKAFAKAEARFEHWQEIVSDYQRRTEDPLP